MPEFSQSLLAVTPYVVGRATTTSAATATSTPAPTSSGSRTASSSSARRSTRISARSRATTWWSTSARSRPSSATSARSSPRTRASSTCRSARSTTSRLIYTRRVGGPADDGSGAGDVTAAVKLNGSLGGINYGVFAATEGDDAGPRLLRARATRDFDEPRTSASMVTQRGAAVPGPQRHVYGSTIAGRRTRSWNVRSTLVGVRHRPGRAPRPRDTGAQVRVDYDMGDGWRQQLYALHLGRDLQLNDFGFLERNNFNYARYELARRVTDLPENLGVCRARLALRDSRRYNDQRPCTSPTRGRSTAQRASRRRQRLLRDRRLRLRATTT